MEAPADKPTRITTSKVFLPYMTPMTLQHLNAKRRNTAQGRAMAETTVEQRRATACGFIEAVAGRVGFPRRTIATAHLLYHRFHLTFPPADFVVHEVALAALLVSGKMNDTIKRTRDILLASYALRFPELVKLPRVHKPASQGTSASTQSADSAEPQRKKIRTAAHSAEPQRPTILGSVAESDIDAAVLESDRKRLLAIEGHMLQCSCFNFQGRTQQTLSLVIKIGKRRRISKVICQSAWRIAADSHRCGAPLQYPPSSIAIASLLLSALLSSPPTQSTSSAVPQDGSLSAEEIIQLFFDERSLSEPSKVTGLLDPEEARRTSGYEDSMEAFPEDVEEVVHTIIDLYISSASSLNLQMQSTSGGLSSLSSSPASPAEPSSDVLDIPSSPGSRGGSGAQGGGHMAQKKIPPHAFAPPPLRILDWLTDHPTASPPQLVTLLTDIKIWLRGVEDRRAKRDEQALLSSRGAHAAQLQGEVAQAQRRMRIVEIRAVVVDQEQEQSEQVALAAQAASRGEEIPQGALQPKSDTTRYLF